MVDSKQNKTTVSAHNAAKHVSSHETVMSSQQAANFTDGVKR